MSDVHSLRVWRCYVEVARVGPDALTAELYVYSVICINIRRFPSDEFVGTKVGVCR